jgi:hypothetical protein
MCLIESISVDWYPCERGIYQVCRDS